MAVSGNPAHDLYMSDEYVRLHPNLHQEDSDWKLSRLLPIVDRAVQLVHVDPLNLLDIGGGAGLILRGVASHIADSAKIEVRRYALDLSPGMLSVQVQNNPDIHRALNEDIRHTSLGDKEIDIALLIDVLEHVPQPERALAELRRIAKFVILKVPLETDLLSRVYDIHTRGRSARHRLDVLGHINAYTPWRLKHDLTTSLGRVVCSSFSRVSEHKLGAYTREGRLSWRGHLIAKLQDATFAVSPFASWLLFGDFALVLVECFDNR